MDEGKPDSWSPAEREQAEAAAENATRATSRFVVMALIEGGFLGVGVLALIAERTTEGIALIVGGLLIGMMGVGTMIMARIKAQRLEPRDP